MKSETTLMTLLELKDLAHGPASWVTDEGAGRDAFFCDAANPATVLAIINDLIAAREALDRIEALTHCWVVTLETAPCEMTFDQIRRRVRDARSAQTVPL